MFKFLTLEGERGVGVGIVEEVEGVQVDWWVREVDMAYRPSSSSVTRPLVCHFRPKNRYIF